MANNIRAVSPSLFFVLSLCWVSLTLGPSIPLLFLSASSLFPSSLFNQHMPTSSFRKREPSSRTPSRHIQVYATSGSPLLASRLPPTRRTRARSCMRGTKVAVFANGIHTAVVATFVRRCPAKRGVIRGLPNARSLYVINNRASLQKRVRDTKLWSARLWLKTAARFTNSRAWLMPGRNLRQLHHRWQRHAKHRASRVDRVLHDEGFRASRG